MADRKTTSVDALYTEGRHFPRGQNRDPRSPTRVEHSPSLEPKRGGAFNSNAVQDPEDSRDRGYNNDCRGYVRGAKGEPTGFNETATNYPGGNFDKGSSWRLKDKGNDWNSGSDPAVIRRPVGGPVTANKKQMRDGG